MSAAGSRLDRSAAHSTDSGVPGLVVLVGSNRQFPAKLAGQFVAQVRERIARGRSADEDRSRHAFERTHSWDAWAEILWMMLNGHGGGSKNPF